MERIDNFQFKLLDVRVGWINGEVKLGDKSLDFRISHVLGDNLSQFIFSVWTFYPKQKKLDQWTGTIEQYDLLPCDEININEEGTEVNWKITKSKVKANEPMLDITITADRCLDGENMEKVVLAGTISYREYATAIMGEIDEMLKKYGTVGYFTEWWHTFPMTEFLIIKATLMGRKLENLNDELSVIRASFYMAFMEEPIRKITLVSDNVCYGPAPKMGEITCQKLTINNKGRVDISFYEYSGVMMEHVAFYIVKEKANEIIEDITNYFQENPLITYVTDVGSWELTLTNEEGEKYKFNGPLWSDDDYWFEEMSDDIRKALQRRDLFVFDGDAKTGLIFLSCEFEGGGRSYYYLTDDETIEEGDYVRVPVGEHGRTAIVEVVEVEYFDEDDVPMPLERVKKIIEKVDEFGEYPEDEE